MRSFVLIAALSSALGLAACAAPSGDDDTTSSEEALTALPAGRYVLERAPLSGSYVSSLVLRADRSFEMELVRVTRTTRPWVWNPWVPVPSREEEKLSLRGRYQLYDAHGARISLTPSDVGGERVDAAITVGPGRLTLTTREDVTFTLVAATAPAPPDTTEPLVASCDGGGAWHAKLRLDQAGRRRGTFVVDRRSPGVSNAIPKLGSFAMAYTGNTSVDDYMRFEGTDARANELTFAIRRATLESARPGETFDLGMTHKLTGFHSSWHLVVTCTLESP